MGRGRKAEDLGPHCGPGRNAAEVLCHPCTTSADGVPVYLLRTSWKGHTTGRGHHDALSVYEQKLQFTREVAENYRRPYTVAPALTSETVAVVEPAEPRPNMEFRRSSFMPELELSMDEREMLFEDDTNESIQYLETHFESEFERRRLSALTRDYGFEQEEEIVNGNTRDDEDFEDAGSDTSETAPRPSNLHEARSFLILFQACLLDVLDNLPHLRLSTNQTRMVMWAMKKCNPADVPSYESFRAMQKRLRENIGVKTVRCVSDLGNIFYINDVRDIVARDFENPETAAQLRFYPEETDGHMSEVWHGQRWREFPLDMLTPAWESDYGKRFYVNELAKLSDGRYVIPFVWVTYNGKVHGRCHAAIQTSTGIKVDVSRELRLSTDLLQNNYPELLEMHRDSGALRFAPCSSTFGTSMPNPKREECEDEDLFTIWIPLWADDVSGARSKQYQKHVNVYMNNSNLPGKLTQQEYFVHFISASQEASAPEILGAVSKLVEWVDSVTLFRTEHRSDRGLNHRDTHTNPVRCYNAHKHRPCRFRTLVPNLQGDNPQQSEECSHIGHNGLFFCRICHVGGPAEVKESNDGYHALYEASPMVSTPRTVAMTLASVKEQLRLASFGVAAPLERMQKAHGVKDKIAQHWMDIMLERSRALKVAEPLLSADEISARVLDWLHSQTKMPYNPLLEMKYLDPCSDTPVEILHTILLGIEKYGWHNLHTSWNSTKQDTFTIRLRSTDTNGLLVPPIRASYMMQYRSGLVGKHFKTLMQVSAFHLQDIATPEQLSLSCAIGELGALLWIAEIGDLDSYLADLTILIDNVLDAFAAIDPSKILVKIKLHLLKHLPAHIRRFGPAVRFATEVFESYNTIFRMSSILSNHLAPSRDIARKNVDLDRVKHVLSGGYWWDDKANSWTHAGDAVSDILRKSPAIQRHLGWTPPAKFSPGSVRCRGKDKRAASRIRGEDTKAMQACVQIGDNNLMPPDSFWYQAIESTAQSGDVCPVGSWVVVRTDETNHFIGRIKEILTQTNAQTSPSGIVTLEKFVVGDEKHHFLNMPVLFPPVPGFSTLLVTKTEHIQFIFNVQHDCGACGCSLTGSRRRMVEREVSTVEESVVNHEETQPKYIINTHALHNATRLRSYLPRHLTAPLRLIAEREAHHHQIATSLRPIQADKRVQTQAKAAETRLRAKNAAQQPEQEQAASHEDITSPASNTLAQRRDTPVDPASAPTNTETSSRVEYRTNDIVYFGRENLSETTLKLKSRDETLWEHRSGARFRRRTAPQWISQLSPINKLEGMVDSEGTGYSPDPGMGYIHKLPDEVLVKIFHLVCPKICWEVGYHTQVHRDASRRARPPIFIGHLSRVCKTWRHIVLAYPSLWSDVDLHIHTIPFHFREGISKYRPEVMEHTLKMSKNHPLTVKLTATDHENNIKFEKAFEILYCASDRWLDVHLDGHLLFLMVERNPSRWGHRKRPMPVLQRLSLSRSRHCDSLLGALMGLTSSGLPSLTHLTLDRYESISSLAGKVTSRGFPWSQITHLGLTNYIGKAWMELGSIDDFFRQVPNLEDLVIEPLFNSHRRDKPPTPLMCLKSFTFTLEYGIGTLDQKALSRALSFLKAPNLTTLKITIHSAVDIKIAHACIPPFLEQSSCSLKRVSLIGFGEALATSTLRLMPTVECLSMSMIGGLIPLDCLTWKPDKHNILPSLTTLIIDGMAVGDRASLTHLLDSRIPSRSQSPRLNAPEPMKALHVTLDHSMRTLFEGAIDFFHCLWQTYPLKGDLWPMDIGTYPDHIVDVVKFSETTE
ncbi:hypothetical protein NMY22_g2322 [Coprinellus aureogranulatus]|nr:hypothetical protein NMY22_g2322 [Coprinellus aureogranulatus]